ncbi:zincin-like metallopeptidase domain-containing protein [Methylobacterium sp. ARG-1]|uniref:ArdC family protein n=1 Tax=Methylobacterium sp. ARG-1 TaxID=1692501 RepID=UPI0006A41CF2|nr:zincin-like metallopeptidase domain-containing protein [Methylobacterium sp. ARG-1]KNY24475.1 antirestriction protein ArdC [Methylobacterium sp. ARG-1]
MPTNELHARLAAAILAQLETADYASWSPPWHGADPMPRNALTHRRYRGINVLALWCAAQTHGYSDARWTTYRQWAALGAQVRRAERGTLVMFYKELPRGAVAGEAEVNDGALFVARAAYVFNTAQVDTAQPSPDAALPSNATPPEPLPAFDAFVTTTSAAICHGGTRACYVPATDMIHLPPRTAFHTSTGYVGTLVHELIHWTGAPNRLARDLTGRFGARAYAAEELVAELGAAFVLADLGIARTPHPNHAAYCASWALLLRADPRALSTAATQASRAADHLTTLQPGLPEEYVQAQSENLSAEPTAIARPSRMDLTSRP